MKTYTREDLQRLADGPIINPIGRSARQEKLLPGKRRSTTPRGYFMPPGSGPEGETCKTCAHIVRTRHGGPRVFRKCGLAKAKWTHGPGSDILAGSPACRSWEKQKEAAE